MNTPNLKYMLTVSRTKFCVMNSIPLLAPHTCHLPICHRPLWQTPSKESFYGQTPGITPPLVHGGASAKGGGYTLLGELQPIGLEAGPGGQAGMGRHGLAGPSSASQNASLP